MRSEEFVLFFGRSNAFYALIGVGSVFAQRVRIGIGRFLLVFVRLARLIYILHVATAEPIADVSEYI